MKARTKDKVQITDALILNGRLAGGATLKGLGKEPVEIKGHFSMRCFERGKYVYGTAREGFNIWTLTGREYSAQLMSYKEFPPGSGTPVHIRDDRILYVGFGRGAQPEVAGVTALVEPLAYDNAGNFLAPWSFPTFPVVSTVRYTRTFTETQLSVQGTVPLTEAGLFTDGDPTNNWSVGRPTTLVPAGTQAPVAYKSFETLKKTQSFVLEVAWEVRF